MLKIQRDISLTNACEALFDENDLINAMLWFSDKPIQRSKRISLHGIYPSVSLGDKKIHIHRLLMMFWINSKHLSGYVVHHLDGNRLNATKENLTLFPAIAHGSVHNKGKVLSEIHKSKIGKRNRERKGRRRNYTKRNVTAKMVYDLKSKGLSFNKISSILNLDWGCVKQRYNDFIHDNPELMEDSK